MAESFDIQGIVKIKNAEGVGGFLLQHQTHLVTNSCYICDIKNEKRDHKY